jgi:hypothetical protein
MIGLTFSLSGMLVFMLYIMLNDFLILVAATVSEVEQSFSQDALIFQDHTYE